VNHVLHTLLVKFSTGLFGVHLWSLRLPALLAGIAVMPAFYLLVRQLFNRYIALIALSLVAVSGPLVEYSALARGYSLSWLFIVLAMLAGRRFAKTNAQSSAILVALFLAFGMWAMPSTIYGALMVYIWLVLYILTNYSSTRRKRNGLLLLSFLLFLAFSFVLYAGVVLVHGVGPLLRDPSLGDGGWTAFVRSHADRVLDLWVYFTASATEWLALIGWVGVIYAAYVSSKYRLLLFAIMLGAVPLVLVQHVVGTPRVWTYSLFLLHLGSAIAVFYALKFIQSKLLPQLGKRARTGAVSLVLLVLFGLLGLRAQDKVDRFPEAASAAHWLKGRLHDGDHVLADLPWDAPLEFHLRGLGVDPMCMQNAAMAPGGKIFVAVGTAYDHTPKSVLEHFGLQGMADSTLVMQEDWRRLEIFAAP
jgi:4-amino-4-deoxy-L-arabinose transferase-like glycosyltransferase